jgi:S-DNA-T family DNA segregation ATPase FtsK/SpoIIIE
MNRKTKYFLVVSLIAMGAFLAVGFATVNTQDWPFAADQSFRDVRNLSGPVGSWLASVCFSLFGNIFAWFIPLSMVFIAVGLAAAARSAFRFVVKGGVIMLLLSAVFSLSSFTQDSSGLVGSVSRAMGSGLSSVLGRFGATITLLACLLLVLLAEVRFVVRHGLAWLRKSNPKPPPVDWIPGALAAIGRTVARAVSVPAAALNTAWDGWRERRRLAAAEAAAAKRVAEEAFTGSDEPVEPARVPEDAPWLGDPVEPAPVPRKKPAPRKPKPVETPAPKTVEILESDGIPLEDAVLPPLSILASGGAQGSGFSKDKLKGWSEVLEDKLANYGIEGRVTAVNQGPLVTTFEFEPAPGVKIKDIVSRSDDLALAMRARSLRLIAPIPGRAVVGIEIPNPDQDMVYLHDVLTEIPDRLRMSGIMVALGVDAVGRPFNLNLCSAPHLLMAGTTGSGKSVSLNCFLASILFQYRPADIRLILVDPKMVELSIYNGIPHLLHPVITDPREAVRVFTYLIGEMERRNELFRKNGVKNIESYNSKVALGKIDGDEDPTKLAYIVLVVDELGDLVLTKGADIEGLLSRLSNMARAVGIHMIVATQRPSVDVIVGKTKANFPTRIAFRVATKVDSRTILDCVGAEKLIGKGDMLFVDAKHPEALRLHGAWLAEEELEKLVVHWKQYDYEESRLDLYEGPTGGARDEETDPYFEDAREIILRYKQGSTSLLQRKLHVGYARAARLLDQLESAGIVGPPDGSKPREVLITEDTEVGSHLDDDGV